MKKKKIFKLLLVFVLALGGFAKAGKDDEVIKNYLYVKENMHSDLFNNVFKNYCGECEECMKDPHPLHKAAENDHKACVFFLLENGADVNARDECVWTPLHRAVYHNSKDVVELLLEARADVNARDNGGWTSLHLAAFKNYKDVAELLLKAKADVNVKNSLGETPLYISCIFYGISSCFYLLIKEHLKQQMPKLVLVLGATGLATAASVIAYKKFIKK